MSIFKTITPIETTDDRGDTGSEILIKYIELMIWLSRNLDEKKKFLREEGNQKYARDKLKEIGMIIPDEIPIFFDKDNTNRPSIWIVNGKQAFKINEELLRLDITGQYKINQPTQTLEITLATGNKYMIDLTILKNNFEETSKKPKPIRSILIDKHEEELEKAEGIEDVNYKEYPLKKVFTKWQIKIIMEYYKEKFDREETLREYLVLVRLPFFEINDNLRIAYQYKTYDEIVLSSC